MQRGMNPGKPAEGGLEHDTEDGEEREERRQASGADSSPSRTMPEALNRGGVRRT